MDPSSLVVSRVHQHAITLSREASNTAPTIPPGATSNGAQVVRAKMSPSGLTTILTTTHDGTGGHKTTLRTVKSSKTLMWWKRVDSGGRNEANSKTAGCRFDSCPTCPRVLNSSRLRPHSAQSNRAI